MILNKTYIGFLLIFTFIVITPTGLLANRQIKSKPSFFFKLDDELGCSDVSCMQQKPKLLTPNIDILAKNIDATLPNKQYKLNKNG